MCAEEKAKAVGILGILSSKNTILNVQHSTKNGNSLSLLEVAWEAEMVPHSVWEISTCVHAPNSLWHEENSFPS